MSNSYYNRLTGGGGGGGGEGRDLEYCSPLPVGAPLAKINGVMQCRWNDAWE